MRIRILRVAEVQARVGGIGRTTIYRWIRDGVFPAPRQVGPHTVGWLEADVDAWVAARPISTQEPAIRYRPQMETRA